MAAICFEQVRRFILTKKYMGVRGTLMTKEFLIYGFLYS